MNVLLINTNRMRPVIAPIGLDYLADPLVAAQHQVRLLDLAWSEDVAGVIEQTLRGFAADLLAVTVRNIDDCYFSSQAFFLAEIKQIVEMLRRASDAPIVLGGVGFSVAPAAVLDYCGADFGIAGDGELALVELLKALDRRTGWERVPNLLYRDESRIRQNRRVPVDLSRLPPRRRALVDNARYFAQGGQAGFETKRGCSMACIYCADPVAKGRVARCLPPTRVVAELSALLAQGIDHLHTCDSEFNLPADHARELCQALIAAGLGDKVRWYAYCAPKPFNEELAALFKRAGCAGIDFGADSGCDEMLRRLKRHFTTADLASTAAVCRRHQIPFMYDLLVGGPGETRKTLRQTIDFMRRVEPDCVGLSIGMRVYDRTPVARQVRAEGELATNPNLHGVKHGNPHFLRPVFYLSPQVGEDVVACVRELVAGDSRFFLPEEAQANANYNYNDNPELVRAIKKGARGAYWDILRRRCLRPERFASGRDARVSRG